jgi:hypothetical protein
MYVCVCVYLCGLCEHLVVHVDRNQVPVARQRHPIISRHLNRLVVRLHRSLNIPHTLAETCYIKPAAISKGVY